MFAEITNENPTLEKDRPKAKGSDSEASKNNGWIRKISREPFVHFMILGILIFFVGDYFKKHRFSEQYEIKVTNKDVYRLASLWEKQYGSIPTSVQIKSLVDNYVREEVLYREGLEAGLSKDDEVIRRRIAQKEEFLFQDLAAIEDPTEDELKKYYEEKKAKYKVPEKLSFSHIYFSPDIAGEDAAVKRAQSVLAGLAGKNLNRAPELGDRFAYLYDYANQSKDDIFHLFGGSTFTDSIFYFPAKKWYGPVRSGYGWHLVYVNGQLSDSYRPLAEIGEKVKADYLEDLRERKNNESYKKIEDKYIIKRDYELPGDEKK